MRSHKVNYLAVGSFVLVMSLVLLLVVTLLTGGSKATKTYYAHYDNVADIKFGTQVLYEGYSIGQVEAVVPIKVDGRIRFQVELSALEDWAIPDDSVAKIVSSGLLAPVSINIQAGKSAQAYTANSILKSQDAVDLFSAMSDVASQVVELSEAGIKPLLQNLNHTVNNFGSITRNLNQFSQNLSAGSEDLKTMIGAIDPEQLRATLQNMTLSAENFSTLSQDLQSSRAQLDRVLQGSDEMINGNKAQIKSSVEGLHHILNSLANHIDSMNHNLDRTVRNMNEFSARIRQNPSLLISSGAPSDEAMK